MDYIRFSNNGKTFWLNCAELKFKKEFDYLEAITAEPIGQLMELLLEAKLDFRVLDAEKVMVFISLNTLEGISFDNPVGGTGWVKNE